MAILIAGAGAIARLHAAVVRKAFGADLPELSVADPNPAALEGFRTEFPEYRGFGHAQEMLARPAGPDDIVIVAVPPFVHRDLALAALQSGRHVLCEKPLAMDLAQAEEMLAAARSRGRILACCSMRFVGLPATQEVKRLIASGAIGTPYHVTWVNRHHRGRPGIEYQPESLWFTERAKNGGGIVQDWGPYDLSTMIEVLQPLRVEVLSAFGAAPETHVQLPPAQVNDVEVHAAATLRFHLRQEPPVTVTYERASCTHGGQRSVIEIEGSEGAVTWDWLDWEGPGNIQLTTDQAGKAVTETRVAAVDPQVTGHDRPLLHLRARIAGEAGLGVFNEQAIFNFGCVRAIYDCIDSGKPQEVTAQPPA